MGLKLSVSSCGELQIRCKQFQIATKHTTYVPLIHRGKDITELHTIALAGEVEEMDAKLVDH